VCFFLREIAEKALASSNVAIAGLRTVLSDPCTSLATLASRDGDRPP